MTQQQEGQSLYDSPRSNEGHEPHIQSTCRRVLSRMTVDQLITEPWVIHRMHSPRGRRQRALKLMDQVGLPKTALDRKPVSFPVASGRAS